MSGRNVIFAKQKIDGFASDANYGGLYTLGCNFPESGFDEGTLKYSFTLEAGETYIVVWDGEEFPVIGQDASAIMSGAVVLGNCSAFDLDGNNEPFALATIAGSGVIFMSITETVDSHTVVIYQAGEDSLLPDTPVDFAYSSSFGVFAHSDFAPTFGIEAGQKYTIVWDNKKYARTAFTFTYADGSECVGLGNPVAAGQEGNNDPFCIVYDVTHSHLHYMSLEQDVSHTVAICQLAEGFDNGSVVLPEIRYDGFAHNSEANIYTLAITADSEYPLFDLVANETYTVYWDGEPYVCVAEKLQADDESEPVFAGNMHALGVSAGNENAPFIIGSTADRNELADLDDSNPSHSVSIYYGATTLPETVLSGFEQDNTGFYGVHFSPAIYQLEAGTEYIVIWDGVEYKVTAIDIGDIMDGFVFAGNGADFIAPDSGEPFAITSCSDSEYSETVFYALRDYDKEHTVEIYRAESSETVFETVFMPLDDYQFIESTNDDGYTAYCTFWDGTLESGRRYRVNWEGTEQIMPARTFDDGTIYIGNLGITGVGDDTGEEFLISNSGDEGICLIATSDTGSSHRMGVWITNDPLEDPEEPAPEDPETPEDPEQAEGIILKDRNGDDVAYYGIETVTFDTTTEGKQQVYSKGTVSDNLEVAPDFSNGDMSVSHDESDMVRSVTIFAPSDLKPENIRKGTEIAGITGTLIGDTEEIVVGESDGAVPLNLSSDYQEITPSAETKVISKVTIERPEGLKPENIAKDIEIAGVKGTYSAKVDISGDFSKYVVYQLDDDNKEIIVYAIMYDQLYADTGSYDINIPDKLGAYRVVLVSEGISTNDPVMYPTGIFTHNNVRNITYGSNIRFKDNSMSNAFCNCVNFNQPVVIPNGVVGVQRMLGNCFNFNQPITIPKHVRNTQYMLRNCRNFNQTITIEDGVTGIYYPIDTCNNFNRTIDLPESITNITGLVDSCSNYNAPITFPNNVKTIISAFRNCRNFNQPINIPNSVTRLRYVFSGCSNFNQSFTIPNSVTQIGALFENCIRFNKPVSIPDGVEEMYALFRGCTNFNQPVIIPGSVNSSCDTVFENCTNFNQPIVIPNSVNSAFGMFSNCTNFNSPVIIGQNVTNVINMFRNCFNMGSNITIYSRNINNFARMLNGKYNNRRVNIFVPAGSNTNTYIRTLTSQYNSVAGAAITWAEATNYFYNPARNIYVYYNYF